MIIMCGFIVTSVNTVTKIKETQSHTLTHIKGNEKHSCTKCCKKFKFPPPKTKTLVEWMCCQTYWIWLSRILDQLIFFETVTKQIRHFEIHFTCGNTLILSNFFSIICTNDIAVTSQSYL